LRVFKNARFSRFARKERISDETLWNVIERADSGLIDADLGGGVIKQRVAREGQERSGGYRTVILYKTSERAFFVYGFAKNSRDNIHDDELTALKKLAGIVLPLPEDVLNEMVAEKVYVEVMRDEK
jgi:hypothetical protein